MAQVSFVVNIPNYKTANLGDFLKEGRELVKLIGKHLPAPGQITLDQIVVSDSSLVPLPFATLSAVPTSPKGTRSGAAATTAVVVGGAAGNITVTGIKTTDRLKSVIGIKDSDQTSVDFMTGANPFTVSAADTINNTSGTASTGYHLTVTYEKA